VAVSRRPKVSNLEPFEAHIDSLSHEGRGLAHIQGKATFIDGALPGERVLFRYTRRRGRFDEGVVAEVLAPSPERVVPHCPHFGVCGGCSLQHLAPDAQIRHKEAVLLEQLRHIGGVEPGAVLPPLTGPIWGYRRKARLGVKYVEKKGRVLIGFREKRAPLLADLTRCEVLHESVGGRLNELRDLIGGLDASRTIPQIEIAVGDSDTALVFRHLQPLSEKDVGRLVAFGREKGLWIYLQPGGPDSVTPLWPETPSPLRYQLPGEVTVHFQPTDFTQVNADINRAMVERVLELLDPQPDERLLDLFCGLGNFTLPLARRAGSVIGVEGEGGLVERAKANAEQNGIDNVEFLRADLAAPDPDAPFFNASYDKVLLDPPRTGALEAVTRLGFNGVKRVVYVSCNPATLARDARVLTTEKGFRLAKAGVMDMFPHTTHVESIALFEQR
jgi:23S rRNA (uracil1939-C5)-methyltransferase